jgi:hypothetical protein
VVAGTDVAVAGTGDDLLRVAPRAKAEDDDDDQAQELVQVQELVQDKRPSLSDKRAQDLAGSAITDRAIAEAGVYDYPNNKGWGLPWSDRQPFQHEGQEQRGYDIFIPDRDKRRKDKDGDPIKVEWPAGLFLIPNILRHETGNTQVLVQEGARQQLAALSYAPDGFNVVGMNGADGINRKNADRLGWVKGRTAYLCLDADHATNDRVRGAAQRVAGHLRRAGAVSVRLVDLAPHKVKDDDGLDDVLARLSTGCERGEFLAKLLDQAQEVTGTLATLPESFWNSRPVLAHIRQAAHARGRSADTVLGAVLARLSSMVDPLLQLDTGLGKASLNLYVAIIGRSGRGKSSGASAAREVIEVPGYLTRPMAHTDQPFRDGLPIGTGEGLIEAYMGQVLEETGEKKKDGSSKWARVRKQVRRNVFVFVDEGQKLIVQISRTGASLGPVFRSMWSGELAGQANAQEATTRILEAGSYALGMVIGFQRTTVGPLLDDAGAGTPQRFLFFSGIDPAVPDVAPEHPGPLHVYGLDHETLHDAPRTGTIEFAQGIKDELWRANLRRVRGEDEDDEDLDLDLDSHVSLLRCKLAGLLALLDHDPANLSVKVTAEDWRLAGMIHDTSRAVREDLVQFRREEQAKENEARTQDYVNRERRAELARSTAGTAVLRVARLLGRKVHEKGAMSRRDATKLLPSRDRGLFSDALDLAQEQGWLDVDEDGGKVMPGASRPEES